MAAKLPFREDADGLLRLNGPSLIQFISIFLHAKKAGTRKSSPAKGKEKSRCSCDVLQIHNALPVPNLGSLYPPDVQNASFFLRGLLLFGGTRGSNLATVQLRAACAGASGHAADRDTRSAGISCPNFGKIRSAPLEFFFCFAHPLRAYSADVPILHAFSKTPSAPAPYTARFRPK